MNKKAILNRYCQRVNISIKNIFWNSFYKGIIWVELPMHILQLEELSTYTVQCGRIFPGTSFYRTSLSPKPRNFLLHDFDNFIDWQKLWIRIYGINPILIIMKTSSVNRSENQTWGLEYGHGHLRLYNSLCIELSEWVLRKWIDNICNVTCACSCVKDVNVSNRWGTFAPNDRQIGIYYWDIYNSTYSLLYEFYIFVGKLQWLNICFAINELKHLFCTFLISLYWILYK